MVWLLTPATLSVYKYTNSGGSWLPSLQVQLIALLCNFTVYPSTYGPLARIQQMSCGGMGRKQK